LTQSIDWDFLAREIGALYRDGPGYPPLPTRLMAGLHIIKYMDDLSDKEVCRRFVENPCYQYFCSAAFFRHELPLDRTPGVPTCSNASVFSRAFCGTGHA